MLCCTRFAETAQLHALAGPGAARRQLTFYSEPVAAVRASPDPGSGLAVFLKDSGGDEQHQLYALRVATGEVWRLSDGAGRNGPASWSNGGDRVAYFSTRRTGRAWDVYLQRVAADGDANGDANDEVIKSEAQLALAADAPGFMPGEWSPDDAWLLVRRYVSANETDLHALRTTGAEHVLVQLKGGRGDWFGGAHVGGDAPVYHGAAAWSRQPRAPADPLGLYYVSDEGSEFRQLRYLAMDARTGAVVVDGISITPDLAWNVGEVAVAPTGHAVAFTVNEDGYTDIYVMNTHDGFQGPIQALRRGPELRGISGGMRWHASGSCLAFTHATARSPSDVYVQYFDEDLQPSALERWTDSEVGGLDKAAFQVPSLVRYPTFDSVGAGKRTIPAFVYRPRDASGPSPVIIHIHGGPEGQARPNFKPLYQFLVRELGVTVVDPNVRGSAGYGKSYLLLDNGVLREDSVKDIGALLDWIDGQDDLDSSRVAVWGGSYGGYMVLASLIHYGHRLRCGAEMVGISNFVTFLEATKSYRRDLRRAEYGDERDPVMRQFLLDISPTTHAAAIDRPLLIAQGANDPRVPLRESEQIRDAVRRNGRCAWYIVAADEGHGFRKKANSTFYSTALVLFFQKHLLK